MKTKKYHVIDEDGSKYTIEEELDEVVEDEDIEEVEAEADVHDEDALTTDEIAALKRLAAVAEKLLATVETTDADEEVEEEVEVDDEEEVEEETEEEILDTDEDVEKMITKTSDSRRSFGAIGSKTKKDSIDAAVSIEDAWQKRYGG